MYRDRFVQIKLVRKIFLLGVTVKKLKKRHGGVGEHHLQLHQAGNDDGSWLWTGPVTGGGGRYPELFSCFAGSVCLVGDNN